MRDVTPAQEFLWALQNKQPDAMAWVTGGPAAPDLSGLVKFYMTNYDGVLIEAEIFGLPNLRDAGSSNFYGMHIHEYGDCSDNFTHTGDHYSRQRAPPPQHTGDLLPLLGNQGYAWTAFYDKRFRIPEIIGRSVIIHRMPDDFMTQPSGNSGEKIGCGVIR